MFIRPIIFLLLLSSALFSQDTHPCQSPATASEDLTKSFRYGCFCGEDYPNIKHPSKKNYQELNSTQREELIELYEAIEPFDDIDETCKKHDICFIKHGKRAKVCNDTIYNNLNNLKEAFSTQNGDFDKNMQCVNLVDDIASVFHTIFTPPDDEDSYFEKSILVMNGAITTASKVLQVSIDLLSDADERYPSKGEKCNIH